MVRHQRRLQIPNAMQFWIVPDAATSPPVLYTAKEILTAIMKGDLDMSTYQAMAMDGSPPFQAWTKLGAVAAWLAETGASVLGDTPPKSGSVAVAPLPDQLKDVYTELVLMISASLARLGSLAKAKYKHIHACVTHRYSCTNAPKVIACSCCRSR